MIVTENCDDKDLLEMIESGDIPRHQKVFIDKIEKNGLSNNDVMKSLKSKMTSGNSIECTGCRITKEEYLVIMNSLAGD